MEREQLEKKFSLSNNENEIKKPFVELFAVCGIILLALMVIFIILKRKKIAIMLAFCMIFAFVASFYKGTQIFKNYGIFAGGNISPDIFVISPMCLCLSVTPYCLGLLYSKGRSALL